MFETVVDCPKCGTSTKLVQTSSCYTPSGYCPGCDVFVFMTSDSDTGIEVVTLEEDEGT